MEHNLLLKQVPWVRQVSLQGEAIRAIVCQRLDWTEEKLNEFQYEAAQSFITVVVAPLKGEDSEDITLLKYSRMFWGWWRNEWQKIDQSVYKFKRLSPLDYEYLHTNDVTGCTETVGRFWSHVPDFIKDGRKKHRKENAQ